MRVRAEEHGVEARKRRAEADARRERERDDDCLLRVLTRPVVCAEESDRRRSCQPRRANADVGGARGGDELRAVADAALYEAKRAGRDRTAPAPAEPNRTPALGVS